MHIKLSLKPIDTCFFRDGRPFSMGEQTHASHIFPPFPSTIYGALRTSYISKKGFDKFLRNELEEEIGTNITYGNLKIKGVYLEYEEPNNSYVLFQLPRDILFERDWCRNGSVNIKKVHKLGLANDSEFISNLKTTHYLRPKIEKNVSLDYYSYTFLDSDNMRNYLLGNHIDEILGKEENLVYTLEPKIGIQRNALTLQSQNNYLYQLDMLRLNPRFQLLIDIKNASNDFMSTILKVGGENKPFSCKLSRIKNVLNNQEKLDEEMFKDKIVRNIKNTGRFKLYFATPTIWKEGWRASWMTIPNHPKTSFKYGNNTLNIKLLAASIGKYDHIGGWDVANHCPKQMFRAIPIGSVYFLELENNENAELVYDAFHNQNICELDNKSEEEKKIKEGFGNTFIGIVNKEDEL